MARLSNADQIEYVTKRGWIRTDKGWEHPELEYAWPLVDAFQVTREAETSRVGSFEALYAALRGEAPRSPPSTARSDSRVPTLVKSPKARASGSSGNEQAK